MDEYVLMSSLDNPHIAKTYEATTPAVRSNEAMLGNVTIIDTDVSFLPYIIVNQYL